MEIILNCYKVRVTSCCRFYFNVLCAAGVFGSRQLFFMASVVASHTCTVCCMLCNESVVLFSYCTGRFDFTVSAGGDTRR